MEITKHAHRLTFVNAFRLGIRRMTATIFILAIGLLAFAGSASATDVKFTFDQTSYLICGDFVMPDGSIGYNPCIGGYFTIDSAAFTPNETIDAISTSQIIAFEMCGPICFGPLGINPDATITFNTIGQVPEVLGPGGSFPFAVQAPVPYGPGIEYFDFGSNYALFGNATYVHENYFNSGTWSVTSVPEPTSLILFGSGLLGLIGMVLRRNRFA